MSREALALIVALAGCTGTASSTEGTTATTTAGAGGGFGGAGASTSTAVGGAGGAPSIPLVDEGLLARYFLDEAPGSILVRDAAPDPLDLDLTAAPVMAFEPLPKRSGLHWTQAGDGGLCATEVGATKVAVLDGATAATLEAVVEVSDAVLAGSRVVYFGDVDDSGRLGLVLPTTVSAEVRMSGNVGTFEVDLASLGRVVLHAVIDTEAAEPAARVRLFVDGAPAVRVSGEEVAPATAVALPPEHTFVLGNRLSSDRSFEGTLYYAAVYDRALSQAEVLQNTASLLDSDDPR